MARKLLAIEFPLPLILGRVVTSKSQYSDVIFSKFAGLTDVHPHFFDVPHGLVQLYEEKLRAAQSHTGTPSAPGLYVDPAF